MTITERKATILARVTEIQAAGDPAEVQDMQDALKKLFNAYWLVTGDIEE